MSQHAETMRSTIRDLYRNRPFRPFFIRLESGDRLDIEHPENIAFNPDPGGDLDLMARTRNIRAFTSLDAVTAVAVKVGGEEGGDEHRRQDGHEPASQ